MHLFKGQGRTTTNLFFDSKPQFSDRVDISVYVTTYEMSMKDLHVPLDVTAGQFLDKQRRLWCELNRRIAMIPPRGRFWSEICLLFSFCPPAPV